MRGFLLCVIIPIIILVFCFIPLWKTPYIIKEPLNFQVTNYVKKEQRPTPKHVEATIGFSQDINDVIAALQAQSSPRVESPVGYVNVINRDMISGTFIVHVTFYSSGNQYSENVTLKLKPDELGEAKYQATSIDANKDEWSWKYEVIPATKALSGDKYVSLVEYIVGIAAGGKAK